MMGMIMARVGVRMRLFGGHEAKVAGPKCAKDVQEMLRIERSRLRVTPAACAFLRSTLRCARTMGKWIRSRHDRVQAGHKASANEDPLRANEAEDDAIAGCVPASDARPRANDARPGASDARPGTSEAGLGAYGACGVVMRTARVAVVACAAGGRGGRGTYEVHGMCNHMRVARTAASLKVTVAVIAGPGTYERMESSIVPSDRTLSAWQGQDRNAENKIEVP